jgi:hypothetical protein
MPNGIKMPGANLTRYNRLAQMLMAQEQAAPPVQSHTQGLASMLRQGLAGFAGGQDVREQREAQKAFMQGYRPEPLAAGVQGPPRAGGLPGAISALEGVGGERGRNLQQQLMMSQMGREQELEDYRTKLGIAKGFEAPAETFKTVESPYGRGGVGQVSSVTGEIKGYKAPEKRQKEKDASGILRYTDTQEPVFDPAKVGAPTLDPEKAFDQETKLRKEFTAGAGDYVKVRDAYSRIVASAQDPSAAGDLALIFNYMKVLDPGSVVRESEFATAQNAAGVPERVRNIFNRIRRGERLGPGQRQDFVGRAGALYSSQENLYQGLENRYRGLAEQYDLDPSRVVYGMGERVPKYTAPTPQDAPPGLAVNAPPMKIGAEGDALLNKYAPLGGQ